MKNDHLTKFLMSMKQGRDGVNQRMLLNPSQSNLPILNVLSIPKALY